MASNRNISSDAIFARRVREARKRRGWSQQDLADRLAALGYPMTRVVLTKLEQGKRQATVEDLFAIGHALGVPLVYLLVPREDEAQIEVVPGVAVSAPEARAWIRGQLPPRDEADLDAWLNEMPLSEVRNLILRRQPPKTPLEQLYTTKEMGEAEVQRAEDLAWEITEGDAIRRKNPKEGSDAS